jgi:hypothetical protein
MPPDGRCSGLHADNFVGNIMASPTPTTNISDPISSVATSSGSSAVYTGAFQNGAGNQLFGQTFTVTGFVAHPSNNGTFTVTASTATTLTLNNSAAVAETASATATAPSNYNLWQHEQGTDKIQGTQTSAVASYFTTGAITSFDANPPHDDGITIGAMQPDIIQSGDMQVQVIKQNNAAGPTYLGTLATIQANPSTQPTVQQQQLGELTFFKDTAKIIYLKFISNTVGGNYQMGRTMLEVQGDGGRDT